jgi:hypothetical protein
MMPELAQLFDAQRARDPTNTIKLRKAFRATAKLRLRQLRAAMRVAVIDHNVLGFTTNGLLSFHPPDVRLTSFASWLQATGAQLLLGNDWTRPYIERAWRVGEQTALRETGKGPGEDRSDAFSALARSEIEGILAVTVQQTVRVAASAIARNMRRAQAMPQLFRVFDKIAQPRLSILADVLVVGAFNDAKLRAYIAAGIKRVGVHAEVLPHQHSVRIDAADRKTAIAAAEELAEEVEEIIAEEEQLVGILTAGDNKVCQLCEDWAEDAPYEIEEVLDVYPLHPRCRCAVYPWEDLRYKGDAFFGDYDPEEPRVAKGSGRESGRWTSGGAGVGTAYEPGGEKYDPGRRLTSAYIEEEAPVIKANSRAVSDVATDLNNRAQKILAQEVGVPSINRENTTPALEAHIAKTLALELKDGLHNGHSAVTWYSDKMKRTMEIAERIHPEIATDKGKRFALTCALSIASQGEKVERAARIADEVYTRFNADGKFPTDIKVADPSITKNFVKMNKLIERLGIEQTEKMFNTEFTNRELFKATGFKVGKTTMDDKVYGSAVLGPKIGQGFYQNLNGNFDPITMDMWFMRSWGRLTGTGIGYTDMDAQREKLRGLLKKEGKAAPMDMEALHAISLDLVKAHEKDYQATRRLKTPLEHAAERFDHNYGGSMVEAPSGGKDRIWITKVFDQAREILKNEHGVDLTRAAAQATWWTPEQMLYKRLGVRVIQTSSDYAAAFEKIAKEKGISTDAARKFVLEFAPWMMDPDSDDEMDEADIDRMVEGFVYLMHHHTDAYDPDEPRVGKGSGIESGRWTKGGASAGPHPGTGYSPNAWLDKEGVIHTSNVYDAQLALFQNHKVELKQLKQVSTLIRRLGETAAEMAEHGEKAPVFNLCNVSVEGTNLFCAEHKGIPRVRMPVIRAKATKEFVKYLQSRGYKTEKGVERADHLRATQDEIDGAKVAVSMARIDKEGFYKRLVVSRDDYILDGHHTWAAQLGVDARDNTLRGDKTVKITRVDIGIVKLLEEAEKWTGGKGKKAAGQDAVDYSPNQPRDPVGTATGGRWTSGGAVEHGMIEATARAFVESRDVSERQQFLSPHPAEELGQHTLLLNREGNVGISIDPQGDIQNVFNNGGPKGGAAKAMIAAIDHGGRTLDCYDGFLPSYYGQFGFKEVQRMKFNTEFAPPKWDFAKYDHPDIVFMAWGGYDKGEKGALERVADRKNWITPGRTEDYAHDWDAAKAASRAAAYEGGAAAPGLPGKGPGSTSERAGSQLSSGASASARRSVDTYNPDQPRVPAGTSGGGQWTSGSGTHQTIEIGNTTLKVWPIGKGRGGRESGANPRMSGRANALTKLANVKEPSWIWNVGHPSEAHFASGTAHSEQEAKAKALEIHQRMLGSPSEAQQLLITHEPRNEAYAKWDAQMLARQNELEAQSLAGGDEDNQLHYMRNALKEYGASTIEQRQSDKIALSAVYTYIGETTETKLLAVTLARYNESEKVARFTLSGGIDRDAQIKSLDQMVKRYEGRADRMEGAAWGDDIETVYRYEKAGFRIAGENSVGMTRLIRGSAEPTEQEKKAKAEAEAKLAAVRKNEVEARARAAAAKLDFDPGNVHFTDEERQFKLNGKDRHFAGSYTRGDNAVMIYHKHCSVSFAASCAAHEIGHRKLDALRARVRDERADVHNEPGPHGDPNGKYWWQKKGGHDAVMAPDGTLRAPYDKKYPWYQAWQKLSELNYNKLRDSDGVSDYSKEYWDGYLHGNVGIDSAYHETIAELSRLKFESGKLQGSKEWNALYNLMDKHWAQMTPIERQLKQPSGEKAYW